MSVTVILYEYPKAHPDVLNWGDTLRIPEIIQNPQSIDWKFTRHHNDGDENIECFGCHHKTGRLEATKFLEEHKVDKLVLWGAFTKEFLREIVQSMDLADKIE